LSNTYLLDRDYARCFILERILTVILQKERQENIATRLRLKRLDRGRLTVIVVAMVRICCIRRHKALLVRLPANVVVTKISTLVLLPSCYSHRLQVTTPPTREHEP